MTSSPPVTRPIRPGSPWRMSSLVAREFAPISRDCDAIVNAHDPVRHDFACFMNPRVLPIAEGERKKGAATHVGPTAAMFSSQSERTMAAVENTRSPVCLCPH